MVNNFWNYFVVLEDDLVICSKFIEFSKKNYSTYSMELAHLLLASASECDVLLKEVCRLYSDTKSKSINEYFTTLSNNLPSIFHEKIVLRRYKLEFTPYEKWKVNDSPSWWNAYNKVKHNRSSDFEKANLENTLNSMAALLILNYFWAKITYNLTDKKETTLKLRPKSQMLYLPDDYYYENLYV